jgi:hypothetical protein
LHRFLGNVNYLRILVVTCPWKWMLLLLYFGWKADLSLLVCVWGGGGAKKQVAFYDIQSNLTSPPILQAPKSVIPFKLYICGLGKCDWGCFDSLDRW